MNGDLAWVSWFGADGIQAYADGRRVEADFAYDASLCASIQYGVMG